VLRLLVEDAGRARVLSGFIADRELQVEELRIAGHGFEAFIDHCDRLIEILICRRSWAIPRRFCTLRGSPRSWWISASTILVVSFRCW